MINQERLLNEFLELVQVDSVTGEERKIADLLAKKLSDLGLSVREDGAGKRLGTGTGNLVGFLQGSRPEAPALLLCAHMDTVEPGKGIRPRVEGGRVLSGGDTVLGADDKVGIAVILEVLRVIREHRLPCGDLQVVFTVGEEGGLNGAKNLDFELLRADMGYVLDSDGPPGALVLRGPTQDKINARIYGRAAHAGTNPEDGINAIQVAAHAIAAMRLGRVDEETTSNVGVISGGVATNIVPEQVSIQAEARSLNPEKLRLQTESMCAALKEAAEKFGARVELETENIYPVLDVPEQARVVTLAEEAARRVGLEPRRVQTGGGSDTHIFNSRGIPTINLGMGIEGAHTTGECITLENLNKDAVFLLEIVKTAALLK